MSAAQNLTTTNEEKYFACTPQRVSHAKRAFDSSNGLSTSETPFEIFIDMKKRIL